MSIIKIDIDSKKKTLIIGPPGVGKSIIRFLLVGNFNTFNQSTSEITIHKGKELEIIEEVYAMAPQLEKIIYVTSPDYSFENFSVYFNLLLERLSDFKDSLNYLILINKIDLISDLEAEQLKLNILIEFVNRCTIDVQFSSFKEQYLFETLKVLVNIIQNQNYEENAMVLMIYYEKQYGIIKSALDNNGITKKSFCKQFYYDEYFLDQILEPFLELRMVDIIKDIEGDYIYPTTTGRNFYNKLIKEFISEVKKLNKDEIKVSTRENDIFIYGVLFSDDVGRTIFHFDYFPDALLLLLKNPNNENFDVDLVSMFINALHKFGAEINIHGIHKMEISGKEMIFRAYTKEKITMTVFFPPENKHLIFDEDFEMVLNKFLECDKEKLRKFYSTGCVSQFQDCKTKLEEVIFEIQKERKTLFEKKLNSKAAKSDKNYLLEGEIQNGVL